MREWRALQTPGEHGEPPLAATASEAAKLLGQSHASLLRWARRLDAGGEAALEPGYARCGRKPLVTLSADEQAAVQHLVLRTDPNSGHRISVSFALRQFALMEGVEISPGRVISCSEAVRDAILKPRSSKHTLTRTLKRQARVTPEMKMLHRGPKTFQLYAYSQPRDRSVVLADGSRRDLIGGDLTEWDDMTFNEGFYVPWDDPADPCAARFGVRAFRAQLLASCDVGRLRLCSFGIVARYNDTYRQKDILWTFLNYFKHDGIPRRGKRLELGSWDGRLVNALGSIVDVNELGEALAAVCPITHSHDAKGKVIEGRFNMLQKALAMRGVNLGRKRGEFEREKKDWLLARNGKLHPADAGYLPLHELVEKVASAITALNSDTIEGDIWRGVPDELYAQDIAAAPLARLTDEQAVRLMPQQGEATIRGGMIRVKVVDLDSAVYFHDPCFARLGTGYKVYYAFDHADLEAGCFILNREQGARARLRIANPGSESANRAYAPGEIICRAGYVERVPQLSLCYQRDNESADRRTKFAQQCRLMFRQVMPFGVGRAARVEERRDGRGGVQRVEIAGTPTLQHSHTPLQRSAGEARTGNATSLRDSGTATDTGARSLSTRGTRGADPILPGTPAGHPNVTAVPRATVSHRRSRWELLEEQPAV